MKREIKLSIAQLLLVATIAAAVPPGAPLAAEPAKPTGHVHREATRIVWEGAIDRAQLEEFEALVAAGGIKAVEFRNSPGAGGYATVLFERVGAILVERRLRTYASGMCRSVCAALFLMGEQPTLIQLAGAIPTHVFYHAFGRRGEMERDVTEQNIAAIEARRGKAWKEILSRSLEIRQYPFGGVYLFAPRTPAEQESALVMYCDGSAGRVGKEGCTRIPGHTYKALGISLEGRQ